jgi:hypothetical protein
MPTDYEIENALPCSADSAYNRRWTLFRIRQNGTLCQLHEVWQAQYNAGTNETVNGWTMSIDRKNGLISVSKDSRKVPLFYADNNNDAKLSKPDFTNPIDFPYAFALCTDNRLMGLGREWSEAAVRILSHYPANWSVHKEGALEGVLDADKEGKLSCTLLGASIKSFKWCGTTIHKQKRSSHVAYSRPLLLWWTSHGA